MGSQSTILDQASVVGVGLHGGLMCEVHLIPAEENTGVIFHLMEDWQCLERIPASIDSSVDLPLRTAIGTNGRSIGTIEHLMAAISAAEIDNLIVKVWGNEIPILDGSSARWCDMISAAGRIEQSSPRRYIRITKEITVADGSGAWCSFSPSISDRLTVEYEIDYDHPLIGRNSMCMEITPETFRNELAMARTFGFIKDIGLIRDLGLAMGASPSNTVVFSNDSLYDEELPLRWPDEPLRHKIVDVVGDVSLAGFPIIGHFRGYRSGHQLNRNLVRSLIDDENCWRACTVA